MKRIGIVKEIARISEQHTDTNFMICHFGYWDGPLNGLCNYDGTVHYYDCIQNHNRHGNRSRYDTFIVYKLSIREKIKFLYRLKKFQLMVGYHTVYQNGRRMGRFVHRKPKWFFNFLFNFYYYGFNFKKYHKWSDL